MAIGHRRAIQDLVMVLQQKRILPVINVVCSFEDAHAAYAAYAAYAQLGHETFGSIDIQVAGPNDKQRWAPRGADPTNGASFRRD